MKAKKKPAKKAAKAPARAVKQAKSAVKKAAKRKPQEPRDCDVAQHTGDPLFDALTLKQQMFVWEYLGNGFNATQAAKTAGYSAKTADSQASRMLKDVKVHAVLAARTQKAMQRREITAERVLDEIAKVAFFDPRRLFRPDGSLRPMQELDDETAAAIAGLDVKTLFQDKCAVGELKKIKIADKLGGLTLLGRYLKLFTDKVEHSGVMGVQMIHAVPQPDYKTKAKETK